MQPVNQESFWRQRIEDAKKLGGIHHAVYISRETLWREIEQEHFRILKREVEPQFRVLDAGCGFGRACRIFNPNRYVGVDFSPDFIQLATKSYPTYRFIQANIAHLPFKDAEFDIAFCISIKAMIIGNLGESVWVTIEEELKRVANKVLILEYEDCETFFIL